MSDAFQGLQGLDTFGSDFNALQLFTKTILAGVHTSMLVKVVACTNAGDVSPVGTVDVQPLVNQVDGDGNMTVHGVVYKLPYCRLQGGRNAVIIDPEPGDIGQAVFCERDISTVINTKAQANPGSGRWFDMADGVYMGGALNAAPTQYVQFNDSSGITITSPIAVTINAPTATINAPTTVVNSTNSTVNASSSIKLVSPQVQVNP